MTGGVIAAVALSRILESLLFGLTPLDPITFVSAGLVIGAITLAAAYAPARRARRGSTLPSPFAPSSGMARILRPETGISDA